MTREERPIPSSPLEPHGREKHDTVWDGGGGKEKPIEARRALGIEIRAWVVIVAREKERRRRTDPELGLQKGKLDERRGRLAVVETREE